MYLGWRSKLMGGCGWRKLGTCSPFRGGQSRRKLMFWQPTYF